MYFFLPNSPTLPIPHSPTLPAEARTGVGGISRPKDDNPQIQKGPPETSGDPYQGVGPVGFAGSFLSVWFTVL
jgi:hypothetical protein